MEVKGWKTLAWNAGVAGVLGILTWATGINWVDHVDPTVAMFVVAAVNVALRVVTDTAIFKSV